MRHTLVRKKQHKRTPWRFGASILPPRSGTRPHGHSERGRVIEETKTGNKKQDTRKQVRGLPQRQKAQTTSGPVRPVPGMAAVMPTTERSSVAMSIRVLAKIEVRDGLALVWRDKTRERGTVRQKGVQ